LDTTRAKSTVALLLKNEVFAIVGAAIEVHRLLGSGFLEAVYQEALELELAERSIPFVSQSPLTINYKTHVLQSRYIVDLVCYGSVLVELNALDRLTSREESQTPQLPDGIARPQASWIVTTAW
jgi:GxxExxY protein